MSRLLEARLLLALVFCHSVQSASDATLQSILYSIADWAVDMQVGTNVLQGPRFDPTINPLNASIYQNGNLARVLLASHAIGGNQSHLQEAFAWCTTFAGQQQEVSTSRGSLKGGYWGVGYGPAPGPGGDIYLGDTGTAVTALTMCAKNPGATNRQRIKYLHALTLYSSFIQYGCSEPGCGFPKSHGPDASPGWLNTTVPGEGTVGCGYYGGHLSLDPYTIATATTGAAFGAEFANFTRTTKNRFGYVAQSAVNWLASTVLPDGRIPYIIDGKNLSADQWPFDTITYVTEGVIAADLLLPLLPPLSHTWERTVDFLVKNQNADGSWGVPGSQDQHRSPRVVSLLQWSAGRTGSVGAQKAVDQFKAFLCAGPPAQFGLLSIVNVSGFIGLVIADLLKYGVTF